jgi:hypothetical protein
MVCHISIIRNSLCVTLCALALAVSQPTAIHAAPSKAIASAGTVVESFTWRQFVRFWKRQLDKTAGVVGVVLFVALGATLLILSKTRR